MKKIKGSLSLEAVISFTIFISFMFMLLTIVKFSLVRITLNTAVAETTKQIATAAYPLSYLIEYENSVNEKVDTYESKMKLTDGISNETISSGISSLFNLDETEVSNAVGTITKIKDLFGDDAKNAGISLVRSKVAELEGKAGTAIVCKIFNAYIEKSVIPFNKDNVTLSIVKMPQSDYAYKKTGTSQGYTDLGLAHDEYSAEDVIIAVEYKYNFALPFLPSFEITMREAAAEHAWLYGGGGVITNREDKIDYEKLIKTIFGDDRVYLGSMLAGKKYHKTSDCMTLWHGSVITSKSVAEEDGYTPCKVCYE